MRSVMFTKLRRRARHLAAALLLVATAGIVLIQPRSAHAIIWYPAPPSCHRDIRPIQWKPGAYAFYEFAYEKQGRRLAGPTPVRGTSLYERVYVYHVQIMIYPWGLVPAGRAEKVCGNMYAR